MEQFDNWQQYWDNFLQHKHGKSEVATEDDLFRQVARTISKKPIAKETFDEIIAKIITDLSFTPNDLLVELCCGNGLFTYELKSHVRRIIAVDFSPSIIEAANKYKAADNIVYRVGNVVDYINDFRVHWPDVVPDKYLVNDSLAYFTAGDLEQLLTGITSLSPHFTFLLTGVPNDHLKWNYYNTEERKAVYRANLAKGDLTNDGLGNWWLPEHITAICERLSLNCRIRNQELPISDYRMDVIISK